MKSASAQIVLAVVLLCSVAASAQKVEDLLAPFPNFSTFRQLLINTGIINEVDSRSSLTFLMPDDSVINTFVASHQTLTTQEVADALRYHILLQYLDVSGLETLANAKGSSVTTLYQTTGRANGQDGFVNITGMPNNVIDVSAAAPGSAPQAAIITNVTAAPYNYSFFQIDNVLVPNNLKAAAPVGAPVGSPLMGPSTGPSKAPATTPPSMTPKQAPGTAPTSVPTKSPTKAPATAPASIAPGPSEAISAGSSVQSSSAALLVGAIVAAVALL